MMQRRGCLESTQSCGVHAGGDRSFHKGCGKPPPPSRFEFPVHHHQPPRTVLFAVSYFPLPIPLPAKSILQCGAPLRPAPTRLPSSLPAPRRGTPAGRHLARGETPEMQGKDGKQGKLGNLEKPGKARDSLRGRGSIPGIARGVRWLPRVSRPGRVLILEQTLASTSFDRKVAASKNQNGTLCASLVRQHSPLPSARLSETVLTSQRHPVLRPRMSPGKGPVPQAKG